MNKVIILALILIAPIASEANDCGQTANVARQAMTDHQYGNTLELSLAMHHAGNHTIVKAAYDSPIYKDIDGRLSSIAAFQGLWYERCIIAEGGKK